MDIPAHPKIYHIVHIQRLQSIISDGFLWCDAKMENYRVVGPTIGMNSIKRRRKFELTLSSHPDLHVGACVPFYFCPRSVMLYLIHRANDPELTYHGGQTSIVHLEADLRRTVAWAEEHGKRWAFTMSNAGARYFEDRADLGRLGEICWSAVTARDWRNCKEGKQAEFLVESCFPWNLVERIGVQKDAILAQVQKHLNRAEHRPRVEIHQDWYY